MVTALQRQREIEDFAPFMTDHDMGAFLEVILGPPVRGERLRNAQEMQEIIERIRLQLRHIVRSVRRCAERAQDLHSATGQRYLRYETAMCTADLRRHWAFYRFAMREYMKIKIA